MSDNRSERNEGLVNRKVIDEETGAPTYHGEDGRMIKNPQSYKLSSRTIVQREADLAFIERCFLRGDSYIDIKDKLVKHRREVDGLEEYKLSHEQVILDCKEVMDRWRIAYMKDADEYFNKEMARLDTLEAEYWRAWEESVKRNKLVETQRIEYGKNGGEGEDEEGEGRYDDEYKERDTLGKRRKNTPPRMRITVRDSEKVGDVEFLKGVERVIDQRLKILGLGQTRNVNINWRRQAESSGIDAEEVINKMVEAFVKEGEKK